MPPPPPPPPMRFTFLQFSLRGRLCGRASAGPAPPRPGIKMAWCWPFHRFQELHGRSVVAHILDPSRPPPSPQLRLGSALEELRGPAARAVSAEALSEYLPAVRRLVCQARFHGSVYRDIYILTYIQKCRNIRTWYGRSAGWKCLTASKRGRGERIGGGAGILRGRGKE